MNTELFVKKIIDSQRISTKDALIRLLEAPPGRKPRKNIVQLSIWYNQLSEDDKKKLGEVILETIDSTLFGFFCVLDHVGFIEDVPEKTKFELYAINKGEKILINDPDQEEMHNIYNSLIQEKE